MEGEVLVTAYWKDAAFISTRDVGFMDMGKYETLL